MHFGHGNICKFLRDDGSPLRPWDDVHEMDEALIDNWNKVVKPNDKVYCLGDVVIARSALQYFDRLNGTKVLIRGNHDTYKLTDYSKYFKDIRGCHYLDKCILTHIPVHPVNLNRYEGNIHGHLHYRQVPLEDGTPDPRYYCVCVEHIDYTPIEWTVVRERIKSRL